MKYPLGEYEREKITSKTGKKLDDINLEEIKKGNITGEDIKISKEMLRKQGQVAMEADNPPMARNFERAAELENKYRAKSCAKMVREAADIYEKRGILL